VMYAPELRAQLTGFGAGRRSAGRRGNVVLFGNVGNGNTGDEALLASVLDGLDGAQAVTVVSRAPAAVAALHDVVSVPMRLGHIARSLLRANAVGVVGGGMFGPGLPPLVGLLPFVLLLAALAGKETAYFGIGVYRGVPWPTLSALRLHTRIGRGITVRDAKSARILSPSTPPQPVGDLAMYLASAPPQEARDQLAGAGVDLDQPLMLIAPKAATSEERTRSLVTACSRAAKAWAAKGGAVAGLALGSRVDYGRGPGDTDEALIEQVSADAGIDIPLVGPDLAPRLAKAVVGEAAAVVGLRFHAIVFACCAEVPAMTFEWEPKTAALLHERGKPGVIDLYTDDAVTSWVGSVYDRVNA
jgi:polysaccharide pyruvyl transferase WcaK-like protein